MQGREGGKLKTRGKGEATLLCINCEGLKRNYNGTSDKGPSEIGMISLQRTPVAALCKYFCASEIETTSLYTRDKLLAPKFGGTTVDKAGLKGE